MNIHDLFLYLKYYSPFLADISGYAVYGVGLNRSLDRTAGSNTAGGWGWMFVSYECCVLPGWVLCVGLITRPEESYRVRYVRVRSLSLDNEEALSHYGLLGHGKNMTLRETFQKRIVNLKEIQGALVNKGNEPSGFIKLGEFLDYKRAY
jgi:hypothetical protein